MDFDLKKYVHESNLIEEIDDEEFDHQSILAWDYLKQQKTLSHTTICTVQKTITKLQKDLARQERGFYRDQTMQNVWIGGRPAANYSMVRPLMENFLLDYKDGAKDPLIAHLRFEKVHPFVDGNGRTGRMLMWWMEIKNGQKPTLFLNSEKYEKYYTLFR